MKNGQSLIELLIAIGAISTVLVAIAAVSTGALSGQTYARAETQATQLSSEQIERLRAYRDRNGYAALASLSCSASDCFINSAYSVSTAAQVTNGITVWFRTSTACPAGKIQVTATSKWTDSKGIHQPTIKTCFTDWAR